MLEFISAFFDGMYIDEIWDIVYGGLLYDNPLIIFYWLFVVSFCVFIIKRILFGG